MADPEATTLLQAGPPALVYVIGETDSGKTTLVRELVRLMTGEVRVAWVDADPGQSLLGPPACVSGAWAGESGPYVMRFVGHVSPSGHLLQMLTGVARLIEHFRTEGAESVVVDSCGFVTGGPAVEFQYQMIDLLRPDCLAGLSRRDELDSLLAAFDKRRGIVCRRLPAAGSARRRTAAERREYRDKRFDEYFRSARSYVLDPGSLGMHGMIPPASRPERWTGQLVGLTDKDGFCQKLAVVSRFKPGEALELFGPPPQLDDLASIQVGSMALRRLLPG